MEQNTQQHIHQPTPPEPQVGFPSPTGTQPEKKSNGFIKWIFAGVGVLSIIGAGIFFVMNSSGGESAEASPTPEGNVLSTFPTPETQATPEPTVTPTPEPVDKTEIKIEILNGTGTAGDATLVKNLLSGIEFDEDNIEAANADSQEETSTAVTYNRDLSQALIDEIVAELETKFADVKARKGTVSGDFDIRILTGPKGANDKMEKATPTAEPTSTPAE